MCIAPILIRNNSRRFNDSQPLYIQVPCGKCPECLKSAKNDWLVRLAYEWYNNKRGSSWFITMTFNDVELPFTTPDNLYSVHNWLRSERATDFDLGSRIYDFEKKYQLPFDLYSPDVMTYFPKDYLKKFFKSLRQRFNESGVYKYNKEESIKFFCVSEYGEKKKRPHFHILLFLPFQIGESRLLDFLRQSWTHRVKRCDIPDFILDKMHKKSFHSGVTVLSSANGKKWNDWFIKTIVVNNNYRYYVSHLRGDVSFSKDYPAQISSVSGIEYVCKYLSKKSDYLKQFKFRILKDFLDLFPRDLSVIKDERVVKFVRSYRQVFPYIHTSNGLGLSILNEFELLSDDDIAEFINKNVITVKGMEKTYSIPAYIINRLMYDNESFDNTLRKLSPVGVKVVKLKEQKKIDDLCQRWHNIESVYSQFLTLDERILLIARYPHVDFEFNRNFFMEDFHVQLAKYYIYFRNVVCPSFDIDCDLLTIFDTFIPNYLDDSINASPDVTPPPSKCHPYAVKDRLRHCWNFHPAFAGFDEYIDCYNDIYRIVNSRKYAILEEERLEKERIRTLLNDIRYSANYCN